MGTAVYRIQLDGIARVVRFTPAAFKQFDFCLNTDPSYSVIGPLSDFRGTAITEEEFWSSIDANASK